MSGASRARRLLPLGAVLLASFALHAWNGSAGLDSRRNFDERFTLHNVQAFLDGRWAPANGYYPSLSYLPVTAVLAGCEALHRATGIAALAVRADGGFTPTAYLLARWLSALWGTLAVAFVARVGRRLFDSRVGLAAAVLLAAMPALAASSAQIKPDALVVLLTLFAFDLTLTAAERPALSAYLAAGAAVGLATAAKYTGAAACLPLVILAVAGGWESPGAAPRRGRRLAWLAAAGLAAVALFFALNPFPRTIFGTLPELAAIYERKGGQAGGSHLGVAAAELEFLRRHHTAAGRALVVAGMAALAAHGMRRRGPAGRKALVTLAYPVGYSLLYAAATTLFKGQNYLPVGAFTALAGGWLLVASADALRRRWDPAGLSVALRAGALVAAFVAFAPTARSVYREAVPSTHDLAADLLATRLAELPGGLTARAVVVERRPGDPPLRVTQGGARAATRVVADLAEVEPSARARADAVVARPEAGASGAGSERIDVAPAPFRAHGPGLAVDWHPWTLVAESPVEPGAGPAPGEFALAVPSHLAERLAPGDLVSLELILPSADAYRIRSGPGGSSVALRLVEGRGGRSLYTSDRLPLPRDLAGWTFRVDPPPPSPAARVVLRIWRDPRPPAMR